MTSEAERLCTTCAAIHITEGQIPTFCSLCLPPRIRPGCICCMASPDPLRHAFDCPSRTVFSEFRSAP